MLYGMEDTTPMISALALKVTRVMLPIVVEALASTITVSPSINWELLVGLVMLTEMVPGSGVGVGVGVGVGTACEVLPT
jgi:hypothetical protein